MNYLNEKATIVAKKNVGSMFDFTLENQNIADLAVAGQFVHIKIDGFFLRRPISICEVNKAGGSIRIVFEVRGKGTQALSNYQLSDSLDIMGPIGNGFELLDPSCKAIAIGGGIGTPPMLEVVKHYGQNATAIIGFRSSDIVVLEDDFKRSTDNVFVTTDDGSYGRKGFVTDVLNELIATEKPDIIYACGPMAMLKNIAQIANSASIRCQVSLEERMGCGVGACLVCACKIKADDNSTEFLHVCKDGPVFDAERVVF